jgi:hypothetical protein
MSDMADEDRASQDVANGNTQDAIRAVNDRLRERGEAERAETASSKAPRTRRS